MITYDKLGGRTIQLYIPFEFNGRKIESISLAPLRLGHVLGWNEGQWKNMIELLVVMAGVEESIIRELRYPDAERVVETFIGMLTPEIRADIESGRIPVKAAPDVLVTADEVHGETTVNGSGRPMNVTQGPGVPLPIDTQPGFDLSEEP
jgi:hypothetical protein